MNLQPVKTVPTISVWCLTCNRALRTDREVIYADLDGTPFRAYYCAACAKALDEAEASPPEEL